MEKTMAAFEVRRQFGKVLQDVAAGGDRFVVERHGEPIAAVVSITVYEQWKRSRDDFFERINAVSERANLTPEQAEVLALEAVTAVRHIVSGDAHLLALREFRGIRVLTPAVALIALAID